MSKIKTNILEGFSDADTIQIPTGVFGEYVQELFDESYNISVIRPTDIISKGPWTDARIYGTEKDQATIFLAVSEISTSTRTLLLVPGVWTIEGSLVIPTNISVYFMAGATMNVGYGSSVTFNGPVIAGPYRIFTGLGTVTIGSSTVITYSAWTGVSGNTATFKTFPLTPSSAPTSDYQMANKKYVDDQVTAGSTIPVGTIFPYAGATAPSGYLLCDGSEVSRTAYDDLFTVISTAYGVGDGSITFNLPDLTGRVPVGKDSLETDFSSLGKTGGESTHTLTINEMPVHSHTCNNAYSTNGGTTAGATDSPGNTGNAGSGEAHNNLQPYLVINYIIKT